MAPEPLIALRDLVKVFRPPRPGLPPLRAVGGVSLDVQPGETLALVGESGSGKSTLARLILKLIPATSGRVLYRGRDVLQASGAELRGLRRHLQIVFQDPLASLNPRFRVGETVREPLEVHGLAAGEREARVAHMLERVGLDPSLASRYPHELSGGQRQRVGIARALVTEPEFVVADEPVSALDVSVRAQIINLMLDLQAQLGLTYVFIAHDLTLVRTVARRIAVMRRGLLVEVAPSEAIFEDPRHPYTQALLSAIPRLGGPRRERRVPVQAPPPPAHRAELVQVSEGHWVAQD